MSIINTEYRIKDMELQNNEDGSYKIGGYINVTNRESETLYNKKNGKYFKEIMTSGVFEDALERAEEIPLLLEHNWDEKLASTSLGDLTLKEDNIGLRFEATIKDESLYQKIKAGIINSCSFGFKVLRERVECINSKLDRRFVDAIELLEVSLVKNPAYVGSLCESRSYEDELTKIREAIADLQEKEKEIMAQLEDIEVEETEISEEETTIEKNLEDKNEVDTVNEVEPTEEEKVTSEDVDAEVLDEEIKEVVEELNNDEFKEKLKLFIDIHKAKM
ncbi:HK97 family phage prohead protease [uncultured Clostridium sp.]|uniref:HK97 family phage prohead protease n=1 Tax=uncultured Clostridium sp. TaxID=59620 RepID=UPI0025E173E3|nr:HK97 family phage prohead protease [uncultured Clostridium sp.]